MASSSSEKKRKTRDINPEAILISLAQDPTPPPPKRSHRRTKIPPIDDLMTDAQMLARVTADPQGMIKEMTRLANVCRHVSEIASLRVRVELLAKRVTDNETVENKLKEYEKIITRQDEKIADLETRMMNGFYNLMPS